MTEPFISRDQVKRKAREAVERGEGPESCPYKMPCEAQRLWQDEFSNHAQRVLPNTFIKAEQAA